MKRNFIKTKVLSVLIVMLPIISLCQQYEAFDGTPPTFMTFDASYVRPTYGTNYSNPTANVGVLNNGSNFSHRFITTQGNDQDACYQITGSQYGYLQKLPINWDGDPNEFLDTVIQIGGPNLQGENSQQIEYYFYPEEENCVLLVNFAFVVQAPHDEYLFERNPRFYIEVLDANGNLLNLGYHQNNTNWPYSRFLVRAPGPSNLTYMDPQATPVPMDYRVCNASSYDTHLWYEYTPIAFNLRSSAEDHEPIRLRIRTHACNASVHWAYGYFAAKCIPGSIDVKACGNDDISLEVPWGFDANSYQWYFGSGPNDCYLDANATGTTYTCARNTSLTYFKCTMTAKSLAPFVYEAYVNYYELDPGFEYEQLQRDCKYEVQFTNTSTVTIINNGQNIEEEVEFVEWDFGDGSPRSHVVNPLHEYAAPGDYQVRLILFDSENTCSDTLEAVTITIDPSATQISESSDTIRDCEKNFPVRYDEATFGDMYEFGQAGTYQVTYPDASANGCDSIVHVTVIVDKPTVVIEQQYDYCDAFYAILHANTNAINPTYLWSTDETTNSIEINTPATYSLTVTDENGCVCQDDILINACTPNIVLPNSITPSDENNLNDYFEIPQRNLIQTIEFSVFDRNGSLVYHTTDKDFKWYGDVNGKTFYHATYNYVLIIVDYNGIESMRKGSITVF